MSLRKLDRIQKWRGRAAPNAPNATEDLRTPTLLNLVAMTVTAFVLAAGTASAHHSFSMFDGSKEIVLRGTLKELQWTNPHCFVQIEVTNTDGELVEWSIEGSSPNLITRSNPKSAAMLKQLKPGAQVTVVARPMRNGASGGSLISVALADGRVLYEQRFAADPPKEAK